MVQFRFAPELWEQLEVNLAMWPYQGIAQEDSSAQVFFDALEIAEECARELGGIPHSVPPKNWCEEWQRGWRPSCVGERFYLAAPWHHEPAPEGRVRLEMTPGNVFGGGDHETTILCLELLEAANPVGLTVVDVGSGTGILSHAARMLGAKRVVACDLEFEAAQLSARYVPAWQGGIESMGRKTADLILINIQLSIIETLLPRLLEILRPGGRIIASGFLTEQVPRVGELRAPTSIRSRGNWSAVTLEGNDRSRNTSEVP